MKRRPVVHMPRNVPAGSYRQTLAVVRRWRMNLVFGLLAAFALVLLGRLGKLQLVDAHTYRAQASQNRRSTYRFHAKRGRIVDRHGHVLADGKPCVAVAVDPTQIKAPRRFAVLLADLLGNELTAAEILERLERVAAKAKKNKRKLPSYAKLIRRVDDPMLVDRLQEFRSLSARERMKQGMWGLIVESVEGRFYPNGSYAAHVLGQVPIKGVAPIGIEGGFDKMLRGVDARGTMFRDGRARSFARPEDIDRSGERGLDVVLTIDIVIQHHLEVALQQMMADHHSLEACGVVLDPRSGEVLAMASRPTFDPNAMPANLNRVTQGLYEPGSLFKPFTVAFALQDGVVAVDEVLDMPMRTVLPGDPKPIRDTHEVGAGTVRLLISESSNTGAALLAHRLGGDRMLQWLRHCFPYRWVTGRKRALVGTGVELPWEGGYKRARGEATVSKTDAHRFGFGQAFSLTPIQMAAAFAGFARPDARMVNPTIVRRTRKRPIAGPKLCHPKYLDVIRAGLEDCVTEGTARRAFDGCEIPVAGKTATAQLKCRAGSVRGRAAQHAAPSGLHGEHLLLRGVRARGCAAARRARGRQADQGRRHVRWRRGGTGRSPRHREDVPVLGTGGGRSDERDARPASDRA